MRTADVALPAVAPTAEPGAGRAPLPQDGPPFGDLLGLMDEAARPAANRGRGPLPDGAASPQEAPDAMAAAESVPDPAAAILDRLLSRCTRPAPRAPERREGDAATGDPAPRGARAALLRLDMAPTDETPAPAAEDDPPPPDAAVAMDTPAARPQPAPLLAIMPAPVAEPRDAPAPAITVPSGARPASGPGAAETGPTDAPEPMRLAVLRQETHFAPVRSFTEAAPVLHAAPRREADPQGSRAAPRPEAIPPETILPETTAPGLAVPGAGRPDEHADAREARRPGDDARQERSGGRRAASGVPSLGIAPARTAAPAGAADAGGAPPEIRTDAAPALPFASLAQVGRAIAAEVAQIDPAAAGNTAPGAGEASGSPARAGPVRVLDIALAPEALGRVVVHMRLTSQGLSVRLKADNPATAELLAGDRDHLAAILKSAGLADVDLEIGGPGLSMLDAPVRSLAQPEGAQGREAADHRPDGGNGGADPGRQGRNSRQDRTLFDEDAAPSFADEPRAGAD